MLKKCLISLQTFPQTFAIEIIFYIFDYNLIKNEQKKYYYSKKNMYFLNCSFSDSIELELVYTLARSNRDTVIFLKVVFERSTVRVVGFETTTKRF